MCLYWHDLHNAFYLEAKDIALRSAKTCKHIDPYGIEVTVVVWIARLYLRRIVAFHDIRVATCESQLIVE